MQAIINRAIELVDKGWTQGHNAVSFSGIPQPATSPHACQFCTMGAVIRACYEAGETVVTQARFREKFLAVHRIAPEAFNDTKGRTKEEVIEALHKVTSSTQF